MKFFEAIKKAVGKIDIVAEDLVSVTDSDTAKLDCQFSPIRPFRLPKRGRSLLPCKLLIVCRL